MKTLNNIFDKIDAVMKALVLALFGLMVLGFASCEDDMELTEEQSVQMIVPGIYLENGDTYAVARYKRDQTVGTDYTMVSMNDTVRIAVDALPFDSIVGALTNVGSDATVSLVGPFEGKVANETTKIWNIELKHHYNKVTLDYELWGSPTHNGVRPSIEWTVGDIKDPATWTLIED